MYYKWKICLEKNLEVVVGQNWLSSFYERKVSGQMINCFAVY